eukprot:3982129-Pleurochrysis_carterae.AAC.2
MPFWRPSLSRTLSFSPRLTVHTDGGGDSDGPEHVAQRAARRNDTDVRHVADAQPLMRAHARTRTRTCLRARVRRFARMCERTYMRVNTREVARISARTHVLVQV